MCIVTSQYILCISRFGLSSRFEDDFPSALTGKVGLLIQLIEIPIKHVITSTTCFDCSMCLLSLPGSSGGIPVHYQQSECYSSEECSSEPEVSLVWVSVLLLHLGPLARASLLSQQAGT